MNVVTMNTPQHGKRAVNERVRRIRLRRSRLRRLERSETQANKRAPTNTNCAIRDTNLTQIMHIARTVKRMGDEQSL